METITFTIQNLIIFSFVIFSLGGSMMGYIVFLISRAMVSASTKAIALNNLR